MGENATVFLPFRICRENAGTTQILCQRFPSGSVNLHSCFLFWRDRHCIGMHVIFLSCVQVLLRASDDPVTFAPPFKNHIKDRGMSNGQGEFFLGTLFPKRSPVNLLTASMTDTEQQTGSFRMNRIKERSLPQRYP